MEVSEEQTQDDDVQMDISSPLGGAVPRPEANMQCTTPDVSHYLLTMDCANVSLQMSDDFARQVQLSASGGRQQHQGVLIN